MPKHKIIPWLAGGAVVLVAAVIAVLYYFSYPVMADLSNLEACTKDIYNRGYSVEYSPSIKIHDSITIGNTRYVLTEIDEALGRVVLHKSITGRYKIDRLSYGGGSFLNGIIESGGKKYLLLGGRNTALEIAEIEVALDGFTYRLEIPKETRFLVQTEIDGRIETKHIDLDKAAVFNSEGEDITDSVDLSGGGI